MHGKIQEEYRDLLSSEVELSVAQVFKCNDAGLLNFAVTLQLYVIIFLSSFHNCCVLTFVKNLHFLDPIRRLVLIIDGSRPQRVNTFKN